MKQIRICCLLLISIFLHRNITAQAIFPTLPTMDSMQACYFYNQIDSINFPFFHPIDTVLSGIEKNNFSRQDSYFSDLGNIGQAQNPLIFHFSPNADFRYKRIPYHSFMQYAEQPKFYRSKQPFSEIYYHLGAKKEQLIAVKFSQTVYRGLTVGLEFGMVNGPGFYQNSETKNNSTNIHLRYFSQNYRYGVIARYFRYKIFAEENGGIKTDSIFEKQLETARVTPINLSTGNTKIRNWGFEVTQFYNLTKPDFLKKTVEKGIANDSLAIDSLVFKKDFLQLSSDTAVVDSLTELDRLKPKKPFNFGRLSLNLKYRNFYWMYDNQMPSKEYFDKFFTDSTRTHDSINQRSFVADFGYSNVNINRFETKNRFQYYLYMKYSYDQIKNGTRFFANHQWMPQIDLVTQLFKTFEFRVSGNYILTGYNKDDASLSASIANIFGKKSRATKVRLEASYSLQMPEWFLGYYTGNHFQWEHRLKKMGALCFGIQAENRWLSLGGNYFVINQYTYLNELIEPEQAAETQHVLRVVAKSKIQVGKFTLDNMLAYQTQFHSSAVRLPKLIYNGSYYFNIPMFKKALLLQPGFSLFYNTSYYADAYQPAVNSFYLQNDIKIGNYLYGDLFVNFNIKRARFFLKYSHLNQGLLPYIYYMVPHYPQPNGGFYFGISWRLFG